MGASPGQIEVWDDIVSIMGAEPGALGEQRLQAEGAAQMRRQVAAEIGRGIMKLGDEARTDVGDQAMLDLVQYALCIGGGEPVPRSEEHTSELQSLMRISYAVFCLKKKKSKS